MRKSFSDFYEDNENTIVELAQDSDRNEIDLAMKLYEDYLESVFDVEN
jgi:hypothetical protein